MLSARELTDAASPTEANQIGAAAMNPLSPISTRSRLVGLACVVMTALGWGLNWPITKLLLTTCPPLSTRGVSGLFAGLLLFGMAVSRGETLIVPRHLWGRLITAALMNVTAWMGLTTTSLLWLPAGQAATLAYTMPIWATLLAWPMLGERPSLRRVGAIAMGISGVVILVGGAGLDLSTARLPGISLALCAAAVFGFATVFFKRAPILLPPATSTAWQVTLGCIPLLGCGLLFENAHFSTLPLVGWLALAYAAVISMGLCYLLWFAAIRRLKAPIAAIGILLTPAVSVVSSSFTLGEPLLLSQSLSLGLIAAGVVLAIKE